MTGRVWKRALDTVVGSSAPFGLVIRCKLAPRCEMRGRSLQLITQTLEGHLDSACVYDLAWEKCPYFQWFGGVGKAL